MRASSLLSTGKSCVKERVSAVVVLARPKSVENQRISFRATKLGQMCVGAGEGGGGRGGECPPDVVSIRFHYSIFRLCSGVPIGWGWLLPHYAIPLWLSLGSMMIRAICGMDKFV